MKTKHTKEKVAASTSLAVLGGTFLAAYYPHVEAEHLYDMSAAFHAAQEPGQARMLNVEAADYAHKATVAAAFFGAEVGAACFATGLIVYRRHGSQFRQVVQTMGEMVAPTPVSQAERDLIAAHEQLEPQPA